MGPYQLARQIIADHSDLAESSGSCSEDILLLVESALEVRFPAGYRQFLADFGTLTFAGTEIYGVIPQNPLAPAAPSVFGWTTLLRQRGMPPDLIPVVNSGDGFLYALDLAIPEGQIWFCSMGQPGRHEAVSPSFETFFLDQIKAALEGWEDEED